ncbi:MAG: family 43 glycosylhydrolase [Prevotellaceae bacterium]|jgi:beta-xylosidase|nr:family 43 glycosylhydrolase [Prevotellaceae bacterium]
MNLLLLFSLTAIIPAGAIDNPQPPEPSGKTYRNPVVNYSLPDPTIIRADNGYFYLYATEDIRNTPIHRSTNLVDWEFVGTAFTDATRPTFEPKGGLWAPDINYIDGRYVLYYSMSRWGCLGLCGIGVAVADRPEGPFTDRGALFISKDIGVDNSIDQFYIEENGTKYLFWGSFYGIYAIALSDDGLHIRNDAEKQHIAGNIYEGTYIHKHNGYYYLFASTGTCCEGITSTYITVVGRSDNLFGPYLNRQGQPMLDNHHEVVIRGNERFIGTGHNSEIVQDAAGNDWILFHSYDKTNEKGRRTLMLERIYWRDGWPEIDGGTPSPEATAPVF